MVKGTLYRYFDTKEDLFRATVRHIVAESLGPVDRVDPLFATVAALLPAMLRTVAIGIGTSRIPAIIRMVMAESRAFPDLASIWHDEVVLPMLDRVSKIIAEGQVRGEIRAGDPRLHALSVIGPMVTGALYNEVFRDAGDGWPSMEALALQHAETMLRGLEHVDRS